MWLCSEISVAMKEDREVSRDTVDRVFKMFQSQLSDSLGSKTAHIPCVKWEDVGGLGSVKDEIKDAIDLPTKYSSLFGSDEGFKSRAGLLLYGPPGTGKTVSL